MIPTFVKQATRCVAVSALTLLFAIIFLFPSNCAIITAAPASIVVTMSRASVDIETSGSQSFAATVQNDSQNKGVNWTLSGTGCDGVTCGTLSAISSASGVAITYTAPAALPSWTEVTLTATSVADFTKSAAATITVTPAPGAIVVTASATSASVTAGASQNFTAMVQNDSQNKGVTWMLLGASCSEGICGSLSASSSASSAAIIYTAPAAKPDPPAIALRATSVTDSTKSVAITITIM